MRHNFPLFQSHLDFAHSFWSQIVKIGDIVIDATCGNGYDTLKLCQLALSLDKGKVYAIDIQEQAIESTRQYLASHLLDELKKHVIFQQACHSKFPEDILFESVKLIAYNLGYLPGGNKGMTTKGSSTLESLCQAQMLLQPGGVISMTCYPGHEEGKREYEEVLAYTSTLAPQTWSCSQHQWINRLNAPTLFLIQKAEEQK